MTSFTKIIMEKKKVMGFMKWEPKKEGKGRHSWGLWWRKIPGRKLYVSPRVHLWELETEGRLQ